MPMPAVYPDKLHLCPCLALAAHGDNQSLSATTAGWSGQGVTHLQLPVGNEVTVAPYGGGDLDVGWQAQARVRRGVPDAEAAP